jgi:hypothetical protein
MTGSNMTIPALLIAIAAMGAGIWLVILAVRAKRRRDRLRTGE